MSQNCDANISYYTHTHIKYIVSHVSDLKGDTTAMNNFPNQLRKMYYSMREKPQV